jgi:hypothetical protein
MTGYIVVNEMQGAACVLITHSTFWRGVPVAGILLISPRDVTAFATVRAARAAIVRTRQYMRDHGYPHHQHAEYTLRRVAPPSCKYTKS